MLVRRLVYFICERERVSRAVCELSAAGCSCALAAPVITSSNICTREGVDSSQIVYTAHSLSNKYCKPLIRNLLLSLEPEFVSLHDVFPQN